MGKKKEEEEKKIRRLEMEILLLKSRLGKPKVPYKQKSVGWKNLPKKQPAGGGKFRSPRIRTEIGPILRDSKTPDPYHQPRPGEMSLSNNRPTVHWQPKKVDLDNCNNSYFKDDFSEKEGRSESEEEYQKQDNREALVNHPEEQEVVPPDEDFDWRNDTDDNGLNSDPSFNEEISEIQDSEFAESDPWGTEIEAIPFEEERVPEAPEEFDPNFNEQTNFYDHPLQPLESSFAHENPIAADLLPELEPVGEGIQDFGGLPQLEPISEMPALPELNPLEPLLDIDVRGPGILNQGFCDPLGFEAWNDPMDKDPFGNE